MKLNTAIKENEKSDKDCAKMRIDKEATERIVKNALGSQVDEDERSRQKKAASSKKSTKKNMLSDSESDSEEQAKEKKSVKKLSSSKTISKPSRNGGGLVASQGMHGATVVPIAAHLKYKKLLDKKWIKSESQITSHSLINQTFKTWKFTTRGFGVLGFLGFGDMNFCNIEICENT